MTTDITELAQSLKAAAENATLGLWYVDPDFDVCDEDRDFIAELHGGNLENNARFIALANPANILTLVEALEKAQAAERRWHRVASRVHEQACESDVKIDELEAIRAAAEKLVRCKGRYHSEQNYRALAALFGVNTPDLPPLEHENVHYADAAEMEIEALRQRIAELEESNAQVIQSRDHYKRMTEEGLKQLAESRTVKLPDLRQIVSGDRYVWSDGVYNYSQDVKVALADAGIKVEAE
ncbi:TPA: ead/Ea22-like family protein [Klebsiella pneumoniae]